MSARLARGDFKADFSETGTRFCRAASQSRWAARMFADSRKWRRRPVSTAPSARVGRIFIELESKAFALSASAPRGQGKAIGREGDIAMSKPSDQQANPHREEARPSVPTVRRFLS